MNECSSVRPIDASPPMAIVWALPQPTAPEIVSSMRHDAVAVLVHPFGDLGVPAVGDVLAVDVQLPAPLPVELAVEAEVEAGPQVEARVGHGSDGEVPRRPVSHRHMQHATQQTAVRVVEPQLGHHDAELLPASIGVLEPALGADRVMAGDGVPLVVHVHREARAVGRLHQRRHPDRQVGEPALRGAAVRRRQSRRHLGAGRPTARPPGSARPTSGPGSTPRCRRRSRPAHRRAPPNPTRCPTGGTARRRRRGASRPANAAARRASIVAGTAAVNVHSKRIGTTSFPPSANRTVCIGSTIS